MAFQQLLQTCATTPATEGKSKPHKHRDTAVHVHESIGSRACFMNVSSSGLWWLCRCCSLAPRRHPRWGLAFHLCRAARLRARRRATRTRACTTTGDCCGSRNNCLPLHPSSPVSLSVNVLSHQALTNMKSAENSDRGGQRGMQQAVRHPPFNIRYRGKDNIPTAFHIRHSLTRVGQATPVAKRPQIARQHLPGRH